MSHHTARKTGTKLHQLVDSCLKPLRSWTAQNVPPCIALSLEGQDWAPTEQIPVIHNQEDYTSIDYKRNHAACKKKIPKHY